MDEQFLNICRGALNVVTDSHILCLHTGNVLPGLQLNSWLVAGLLESGTLRSANYSQALLVLAGTAEWSIFQKSDQWDFSNAYGLLGNSDWIQ